MIPYIQLIGGLILLVISGDYLVKGGVAIAQRLRVSSLIVGMTVVAFGTSAPELLVSLQAALVGNPDIALGNVIGSNIANIGLILGITALIYPIAVNKNSIRYDMPMLIIASILFILVAQDGDISRFEGFCGILILILFVTWSVRKSRKEIAAQEPDEAAEKAISLWLALFFIVASSAGLAYGARLLVDGASSIALSLGVSQRIIGVTIVAFGTSVPELAASVIAAYKKEADISIGNIIGSNIFNILCVIGLTATISPIPVAYSLFASDYMWMLGFALLLGLMMMPLRRKPATLGSNLRHNQSALFFNGKVGRISGVILVACYIVYIFLLF